MPMQNTGQEKFVERFEKAVMQYVILSKAKQGEVTRDNLQQTFRGNLQMLGPHFESCIRTLASDGHLREVGGNKYTITDDGREDVQKLQNLVLELPNVVQQAGGVQRPGMSQPASGQPGSLGQTGRSGPAGRTERR